MKKTLFAFVYVLCISFYGNSQLTEGHISYSINVSTDNPEMQSVIGMFNDSKMEVYFSKDKTRSEMNMGVVMNITTISDIQSDSILMLMGGITGQNAVKMTISEMIKEIDSTNFKVTLLPETKDILNYKCKKAKVSDSDGNESVYWYTNEINVSKQGQTYLNSAVPGFPMEFELNNRGVKLAIIVSKLDKKIDVKKRPSLFSLNIPTNYNLISKEDLLNMGM